MPEDVFRVRVVKGPAQIYSGAGRDREKLYLVQTNFSSIITKRYNGFLLLKDKTNDAAQKERWIEENDQVVVVKDEGTYTDPNTDVDKVTTVYEVKVIFGVTPELKEILERWRSAPPEA